jgi:tripartite-type tricarboxylate transporter receptor subunit TctC
LFAPARTPSAVIQRLQQEVARIVARVEVKERFFNAGTEVVGSSPAELAAAVQADMAAMGKVIKAAGIRAD